MKYTEAMQESNLKQKYFDYDLKNLSEEEKMLSALDENAMRLLFEDENYFIVNYNEFSNKLHFINVINKKSLECDIIELS